MNKRDTPNTNDPNATQGRTYTVERVGPARIVQLYADGFDRLSPGQRILSYYLSRAAIAGRDIAIDQHHPQALGVRELLESVYVNSKGIDPSVVSKMTIYLKLFWVNNGFYDNLTSRKFLPDCSFDELKTACEVADLNVPGPRRGESLVTRLERLKDVILDPARDPVMTNKTPGAEWVKESSVNYYDRELSYSEVEAWARSGQEKNPLNSKVTKEGNDIKEQVWRAGGNGSDAGTYRADLRAVVRYLEKAIPYAESDYQAETIRKLVRYLTTGDLSDFRAYNIHWVTDSSTVDFILGFIEVYLDPRGQKGEWEADVFYVNPEQTELMQNLAKHAQHFEDRAPWKDEYKKTIDRVPLANVINVVIGTGGTGPVSPVGINLPNEQAIRQQHGSKSVLLHNVVEAYDKSTGKEVLEEFAWDEEEIENHELYGSRADNLHTALHEVIGHGSGKVSEKLKGENPADFLAGYYSTVEETRADLVALWHVWDKKLVEIGVVKDVDELGGIAKTMYQQAVRTALTQLRLIGGSSRLEEDHMKDRQLIAHYIMQNSDAVKVEIRRGKTYYRITDYRSAHATVGKLLAEVMRIKAEGDIAAAMALVNNYGLNVDIKLRDEVQERAKKLDLPLYTAFVMPELQPVLDSRGEIADVSITYPRDLAAQMLKFSAMTKWEESSSDS